MLPTARPDAGSRTLFSHDDPAAVAAWCRERASAGGVYVAPSAAARRALQRSLAGRGSVSVGVAITTPARLVGLLESRAGVTVPRLLPPTLERLLVEEAARGARVPLFDDREYPPAGATAAVSRLIADLRANGVDADTYAAAGGDPRAAAAYAEFERRRKALGMADEIDRIEALVRRGVPPADVVLEEPVVPSASTLSLLRSIAETASSLHIGVSDLRVGGASGATAARLAALALDRVAERGYARRPELSAIGGAGMYDEIELVARRILALLRGPSAPRPSDVLAVVPSQRYLTLTHEALGRLGVPVATPRRVAVLDVPMVRALLEALALLADPTADTPERGLELLATPYVGLSLGRHDRVARVLVRHGLGGLRSWRSVAGDETPGAFRRFADAVDAMATRLRSARTPHDHAEALSRLALEHGFLSSGRRQNLATGRDDLVRLDQLGWNAVVDAMEELNESLRMTGVSRLSVGEWLGELREALADCEVRAAAKAVDGVHLARPGAGLPLVRHVFALGWREGLVPRRVREDPLLPDRVKRALNANGALFALSADRADIERERRERIVRAAGESLVISWPATGDEGEAMLPSFYLDDLGITRRDVRSVGDVTWPMPLAASREEQLARATMIARHRPVGSAGTELADVRAALSAVTPAERRAYDGAMHAGRAASLGSASRAALAPLAREMSATQARMLAHCAYEHFGKRRLGIAPLTGPAIDPLSVGGIAHRVLARVGRAGWDGAQLDAIIDAAWAVGVPEPLRGDPAEEFQREILREQLHELVESERELLAASQCTPTHFELAFGMADDDRGDERDAASLADGVVLSLPAGSAIPATTLRGSIDRVDVVERDGKRYAVAIDYKSGKGESNYKDESELADFQLSIYCEALPRFGLEPVGALYLGIAGAERYGVIRADFADAFGATESKKMVKLAPEAFAAFVAERRAALAEQVARLAAGQIEIRPRKDDCKYCDLRPVCRIGTFGVGAKGMGDA